jgi:hypothetical protein
MKNKFLIVLLFTSVFIYAQRGGGGMGRGQQQNQNGQQSRVVKEFKTSEVVGIFYYDVEKVVKKIKVKNEDLKAKVSKALRDYNFKIKEISLLNADNFEAIDILMKSNRGNNRGARQQNNTDNNQQVKPVDSLRIRANIVIRPIRREVNNNEAILNETLEGILSEKQNKKWLKYQETQKEKLKPKRPQRNNNQGQGQGQRGNRQRGGF